MKSRTTIRVLIALVLGTTLTVMWASGASMQTVVATTPPTIADLVWMSGDWQTAPGESAQIEEHWTLPAGGTMLGMGRTIVGDKTVEFEFLRIEQRANGIYYVANPQGGPATDFKLTRVSGQEAIFENPEHDFPKRIIYKKTAGGTMVASVDGGEKTRSQNFTYLPLACLPLRK